MQPSTATRVRMKEASVSIHGTRTSKSARCVPFEIREVIAGLWRIQNWNPDRVI